MTSFHFEAVFSREIFAALSVIATPSTTRRSQPDYRYNNDAIMNHIHRSSLFVLHALRSHIPYKHVAGLIWQAYCVQQL